MEYKEFINQIANTAKRAYDLNLISRKHGLAALIDAIDQHGIKSRDIFEYGIRLVIDDYHPETVNFILSNIIQTEENETARRLGVIKKEAVLCIHKELNSWLLLSAIFALTSSDELKDVKNILGNAAFSDFFEVY